MRSMRASSSGATSATISLTTERTVTACGALELTLSSLVTATYPQNTIRNVAWSLYRAHSAHAVSRGFGCKVIDSASLWTVT